MYPITTKQQGPTYYSPVFQPQCKEFLVYYKTESLQQPLTTLFHSQFVGAETQSQKG